MGTGSGAEGDCSVVCLVRGASAKKGSFRPQGHGGLFLQHLLPGWIVERAAFDGSLCHVISMPSYRR